LLRIPEISLRPGVSDIENFIYRHKDMGTTPEGEIQIQLPESENEERSGVSRYLRGRQESYEKGITESSRQLSDLMTTA